MMNEQDRITLDTLRANVAALPEPHRHQVQQAIGLITDIVSHNGEHGLLALAIVAAEQQVARFHA